VGVKIPGFDLSNWFYVLTTPEVEIIQYTYNLDLRNVMFPFFHPGARFYASFKSFPLSYLASSDKCPRCGIKGFSKIVWSPTAHP
jgi:hypothetical protein